MLETNDDGFFDSYDSYLDFRAPYTGIYFIGVTDRDGSGDFDHGYVLNISPSREDYNEDESNDRPDRSDEMGIPSTMFAKANDDEDLDVFEFRGSAGEAIVVDIDADLLLSEMDAVVELYDSQAKLLFFSDDFDGRDPRFNIVLPYTGTYYLIVYDLNVFGSGDDHYYALNLSSQSAALAPKAISYKTTGGRLRVVKGSGFDPSSGGSTAEIDGVEMPSFNVAAAPTTKVRLNPTGLLSGSDSITVVNPDGRRSNPIVLR